MTIRYPSAATATNGEIDRPITKISVFVMSLPTAGSSPNTNVATTRVFGKRQVHVEQRQHHEQEDAREHRVHRGDFHLREHDVPEGDDEMRRAIRKRRGEQAARRQGARLEQRDHLSRPRCR